MNGTIKVTGGKKLSGTVTPIPNKNALLKVLVAPILTSETVNFKDIPNTTDVTKTLDILGSLGAEIKKEEGGKVSINCKNINTHIVPSNVAKQYRASILFVGPLLARFKKAEVPLPGGCTLGKRSISAHIDVFTKTGVLVEFKKESVLFSLPSNFKPQKKSIWQLEASVTSTENFAMFAAGIEGEYELINAACEPHTTDLLNFLIQMGAEISGVGSNRIIIKGKVNLKGANFVPRPDHVDIAGYIVASALTGGSIRIKGANIPDIVDGIINNLFLFNIDIKKDGKDLITTGLGKIFVDTVNSGMPLASDGMPKFKPQPWPGFPVDCLPPVVALATKCEGKMLIQNWMYETGLEFIAQLNEMGANIYVCDPQRVIVYGPCKYKGGEVTSPGVIQACKALFLASLADPVTTIIHGVDILKRRYPNIIEVYRSLGAEIEVL